MGLFNIFRKKEQSKITLETDVTNNSDFIFPDLVDNYNKFYDDNKDIALSYYGLIPFGEKGNSRCHKKPYTETLRIDFPFTNACIWEDFEDDDDVNKVLELVQYGNITIAKEGCETFWILITTGKLKGEVWLLTESGITPIEQPLTLHNWKAKQIESNNSFWYKSLKNWGPVDYAFFYGHAPKKMVTSDQDVFGVTTSMCEDCLNFISKAAIKHEKNYVVTDNIGTRIFEKDGSITFAD